MTASDRPSLSSGPARDEVGDRRAAQEVDVQARRDREQLRGRPRPGSRPRPSSRRASSSPGPTSVPPGRPWRSVTARRITTPSSSARTTTGTSAPGKDDSTRSLELGRVEVPRSRRRGGSARGERGRARRRCPTIHARRHPHRDCPVGTPSISASHRVGDLGDRLVACERLEPARHVRERDEDRRRERQREDEREGHRLGGLGVRRGEADVGETPREAVGEDQHEQARGDVGWRTPPCGRKPTRKPTPVMMISTSTLRSRSATVRPPRTAMRAIGSARNRSMRPFCRSSASPIAVPIAPKSVVWTRIPGIR